MKVLVVGGAGYIGSLVCRKLLDKKHQVRVLDNLLFGGESLIEFLDNKNFELIKGDIRNKKIVNLVLKDVNNIINLAALVGEHACQPQPKNAWEVNYKAAVNLAEKAQKNSIKRFIFVSTCSTYGIIDVSQLATEGSPVNPISLYGKTKVEAESEILALKSKNFYPTILRLATVFGLSPRMRFDLLLNELVKDAFLYKKLTIYQPKAWRPLVHLNDVVQALDLVLNSPISRINGQVFNVGFGNYQKEQLVALVKKYLPATKVNLITGQVEDRNYRVSFKKVQKVLGFQAKISAEKGIKEILTALKLGVFPEPEHFRYSNKPWPKS